MLSAKLGVWGIALIVVTSAGLIYLALQKLFVVAATDTDPDNRPVVDLGPRAETLDEGGVPTVVTAAERDACVALANEFYAALAVEEKLSHVRQPERVRPLMEAWYRDREIERRRIAEVIFKKKRTIGERRFVMLAVEFDDGGQQIIAVEQSADGESFLFDWEVSVGYQPMPLEKFRNAMPTDPIPFRVLCKLADDYRAPFEDAAEFQCVRLTYPGDNEFRLTGYIDRGTDWADEFLAKLEFGGASVIAGLRYPEDPASDAHVEVVRIVHESWFY